MTDSPPFENAAPVRDRILQAFFDAPGALCGVVEVVDDDIRCVVVNKAAAALLGKTPPECVGRSVAEFGMSPDDRRLWMARLESSRGGGEPASFPYRPQGAGDTRSFRAVVTDAGDGPHGPRFAFSAADVTAAATTERALRRTEESYATLVRHLSGAVYRLRNDPQSTVEFISDRCLAITGYEPDELIGNRVTSLAALIHPDDANAVGKRYRANFEAHRECSGDYRIVHRDGSIRWVSDHAKGVYSDAGELLHVDGFMIDITGRRREAEERQSLREQLFHAQRVDSLGRLAGGIAHDFNNLLSVVLGHTELIATQLGGDETLGESVSEIRGAVDQSIHLTRQLLGFARRQPIAPRLLDLNEVVGNLLKLLRRLIGEGMDVRWNPDAVTWPVRIDPTQVDQILTNLCVNARDAARGTGYVTISTRNAIIDEQFVSSHDGARVGEYAELVVQDNGSGMDAVTRERAFEPFFTTKTPGQGTGLGLSTVYGIVKQNDGYIDIESTPGVGTAVHVYFPRPVQTVDDDVDAAEITNMTGGTETILLVEDDKALLGLANRVLERLGYTVFAADTPGEAIRHAVMNMDRLQLLVTDIVMPRMNGRELAALLRAERPDLAVLCMSGYAGALLDSGPLAPDMHFLEKPFTTQQLAMKVRDALDGRPPDHS